MKSLKELKGIQEIIFTDIRSDLDNLFDSKIETLSDLNKRIPIDKYYYDNFIKFKERLLEYCKDYEISFKLEYYSSRNETDYYIIFTGIESI